MKKLFIYAAALLAFCGCENNDDSGPASVPDAITVAPERATVSSKGGSPEAVVTSSGVWTLTGSYDWATPSVTTGKDGTIVKFTVAANDTETDKIADFTFTVGKKTAPFQVVSKKKGGSGGADEIIITPESEEISQAGGSVDVIVTSSGAWTLTGEYAWATPSATTGEDGDVVTFTVAPNTTDADLTANFVFTVGTKEAPFTLVSKGNTTFIERTSPGEVTLPFTGGEIEILLDTNINYRELQHEESGNETNWLQYAITLQGEGMTGAKVYYNVGKFEGTQERRAIITIKGAGGANAQVTVIQKPEPYLDVDKTFYFVELTGGTVDIPVSANIEYGVTISESGAGWLTYAGKVEDKERFTVTATDASRQARITFTEKDGIFTKTVDIIQQAKGQISIAANMKNSRAWPAWTDPTPVSGMETCTIEALVNGANWNNNVSTILGIEDHFLIRVGDNAPKNRLQVATASGGGWNPTRVTIHSNQTILETNRWYHVAVTFDKGAIKIYIDGVEAAAGTNSALTSLNLGVPHNNEAGPTITRCFWVGYSFEASRYLDGMLSEVRIWNKVLTPEEINATNHFYEVDPASEGLVTYWKFNDGEGANVKDYTTFHNDLTSDAPLNWSAVSIP